MSKLDLHVDRLHRLAPQLLLLARQLVGLRRVFDQQRRAIGAVAPAVAIAVDVAVGVEQGLGARRVVVAHLALPRRVVPGELRRDDALRGNRLAAPDQGDFLLHVIGQRQRAAQCDLVGRVAADHRMLHAEVGECRIDQRHALDADATPGQMRRQLVVRDRHAGEFVRQPIEHVVLAVEESQPARLRLFDDADLDAVDQRQLAALHLRGDGLRRSVAVTGLFGIGMVAVIRVALEHDPGAALPLHEAKRPGTHRVFHRLARVGLDHLARHCAHRTGIGQHVQESRRRRCQADLEGIAVERAQPLDLGVVGKRLLVGNGLPAQLRQTEDSGVFEQRQVRALVDAGRSGA